MDNIRSLFKSYTDLAVNLDMKLCALWLCESSISVKYKASKFKVYYTDRDIRYDAKQYEDSFPTDTFYTGRPVFIRADVIGSNHQMVVFKSIDSHNDYKGNDILSSIISFVKQSIYK